MADFRLGPDSALEDEIRRATILVVDDEELVVASIKAYLDLQSEYRVVTFTSPRQALDFLSKEPVDLIVADYLMAELNGVDFLARARDLQPHATRILLTGCSDRDHAIRAINQAGIFQYLEKPWDNDQLRIALRNGLEKRFLIRRLEEKIRALDSARADLADVHQAILKAFI